MLMLFFWKIHQVDINYSGSGSSIVWKIRATVELDAGYSAKDGTVFTNFKASYDVKITQ